MSQLRTAVVSGAGSVRGIGRATAVALAHAGWATCLVDIDGDAAVTAAESIERETGVLSRGFRCDVTNPADVGEVVLRLEDELPAVGGLVNNAGLSSPTRFLDLTLSEWERMFAVNVTGAFHLTHALVPHLVERGFGRIVMISSAAGQRGGGYFGGVHYSASKAALLGFAKSLARELGASGVTVNTVAPGAIDTDIRGGLLSDEGRAAIYAATPVGRFGLAREVAAAVAYLFSADAAFVTGATLDVNGGSHIH